VAHRGSAREQAAEEFEAAARDEPDSERQDLLAYAAQLVGETLRDATVRAAGRVLAPAFGGLPVPELGMPMPEPEPVPEDDYPSLVDLPELPELLRTRASPAWTTTDPELVVSADVSDGEQLELLPELAAEHGELLEPLPEPDAAQTAGDGELLEPLPEQDQTEPVALATAQEADGPAPDEQDEVTTQ
jgi:hypothetical protein